MKRIICLFIIAIVLFFTIMDSSFAESSLTSDISDENVKAAVERLNSLGIINGMEDGKYHPEEKVTREQFAKILVVALGLEDMAKESQGETTFSDVDSDRWSAGYISAAVEQGIIKGYPDGTFQPEKTVSYAEALTMLIRSLGYKDEYLTGSWPENYIEKSEEVKITEGLAFSPTTDAHRGTVAIMVDNALEVPMFEEGLSGEVKTLLSMKLDSEKNNEVLAIELTLEDAIEIALKDSPTIEQAKLKLEKSQVDYEQSEFSIKKNKDDIKEEYGENSITYLEQITKSEIINDFSWEIAQREYKDTIDKQIREVEKMYFDVLHAQKNVEIYEENLKLAKDLYDKTQKEFQVGIVTETEVASSELNYEKTLKGLTDAQNKLESLKMELNIMLGYDLMEDIVLIDELEPKTFEEVDITEAVNEALENNVDLLKAQLSYEVAKIDMEVTAKRYPEIVFEYRQKAVALKEAEESLKSAKKTVEKNVRDKYSSVIQKEDGIETSQKSVEYAQKVLNSTTLSYDIGLKVLTDVQEAQIKLQTEKLTLAKDILDYNLAVLEVEESLGNEIE